MEKYFENFNENRLNYTFKELDEILKNNGVDYDCYGLAYQMTAYEKGYIDYKKGLNDLLEIDFGISEYNDYLIEKGYEPYVDFDENTFNEYFTNPWEAMRTCHFGEVNFSDEYFTFNGYGNIETKSEDDIIYEAKNDDDFIESIMENEYAELLENEFKDDIIKMTFHLVHQGF